MGFPSQTSPKMGHFASCWQNKKTFTVTVKTMAVRVKKSFPGHNGQVAPKDYIAAIINVSQLTAGNVYWTNSETFDFSIHLNIQTHKHKARVLKYQNSPLMPPLMF